MNSFRRLSHAIFMTKCLLGTWRQSRRKCSQTALDYPQGGRHSGQLVTVPKKTNKEGLKKKLKPVQQNLSLVWLIAVKKAQFIELLQTDIIHPKVSHNICISKVSWKSWNSQWASIAYDSGNWTYHGGTPGKCCKMSKSHGRPYFQKLLFWN